MNLSLNLFSVSLPSFFENIGDLAFVERPYQAGLPIGAANVNDFDGDGFVDFFGANLPWRNRGNDNHYLTIDLVGTASNRDGVGARVLATTGELRQMRELYGGFGWVQDEMIVHFGTNQATSVDQLEVRWPSGQVDFIDNIPADQHIRVIEGQGTWLSGLGGPEIERCRAGTDGLSHPPTPSAWRSNKTADCDGIYGA